MKGSCLLRVRLVGNRKLYNWNDWVLIIHSQFDLKVSMKQHENLDSPLPPAPQENSSLVQPISCLVLCVENSCFWRLLRAPWAARRSNQSILKEISPGVHWKDWCWSWNSNTLATWCEELTHLQRPWCWERLKVGGVGDDRGWDGWMASLTQWTWVWVDSGSWWWTGRFMGWWRAAVHGVTKIRTRLSDWTELNWVCVSRLVKRLPFPKCMTLDR